MEAQEEGQGSAHFEKLGEMAISTTYAHLHGLLNVNLVVEDYNELSLELDHAHLELLSRTFKGSSAYFRVINATFRDYHISLRSVKAAIQFTCMITHCEVSLSESRFSQVPPTNAPSKEERKWKSALHHLSFQGREKRDLLGGTALGISLFNAYETYQLKREIDEQKQDLKYFKEYIAHDKTQQNETQNQITAIRAQLSLLVNFTASADFRFTTLIVKEYLGFYISSITGFCDGINHMIISKQIVPSFFHPPQVMTALRNIKSKAEPFGLVPVFHNISGIIDNPLSYLISEGDITFIIHTYLRHKDLFTAYRFLPIPITLPGKAAVVPRVANGHDIIATTDTIQEYFTLSEHHLRRCKMHAGLHICPHFLTEKHPEQSCLGSLFLGKSNFILHYCNFSPINPSREEIVQISNRRLHVSIPSGHSVSAYTTCGHFDTKSSVQNILTQNQFVDVSPGCTFSTENFIFRSLDHVYLSEHIIVRQLSNISENINAQIWDTKGVKNVLPKTYHIYKPPKRTYDKISSSANIWYLGTLVAAVAIIIIFGISVLLPNVRSTALRTLTSCLNYARARRAEPDGRPPDFSGSENGAHEGGPGELDHAQQQDLERDREVVGGGGRGEPESTLDSPNRSLPPHRASSVLEPRLGGDLRDDNVSHVTVSRFSLSQIS